MLQTEISTILIRTLTPLSTRAREFADRFGFEVRFDSTIPSGADTFHFTIWRATDEEREQWESYTRLLEQKALEHSKKRRSEGE